MEKIERTVTYLKTKVITTYKANGQEYNSAYQAREVELEQKMIKEYSGTYVDLMDTWVTNKPYNKTLFIDSQETLDEVLDICNKKNVLTYYNIYIRPGVMSNQGVHKIGTEVYIQEWHDKYGDRLMFGGLVLVPVGADCYEGR